jgi:hypothetical protein
MIDHGNRGERVQGVRYQTIDPIVDQLNFDKLPKPIRRFLIDAPCRLSATETLQALNAGQSATQILTRLMLGVKGYIENAERQKQSGERL